MSTEATTPTTGTAATPATGTAAASTTRPAAASGAPAREHRYDIDLIRVLSSAGVILCHVAAEFMTALPRGATGGRAVYWTGLASDALSRCAVPLFFAMAGWVVLAGAPATSGGQVRRRLVRIVVPFGVWTAAYLVRDRLRSPHPRPLWKLAVEAVFGSVQPAFHLWYLYAYVPVVLLLALAALVRAGQRPWGLGAVLLGLALAPELLTDMGRLTGRHPPAFGWNFALYQVAYAVAGAFLFALPRGGRALRRRTWAGAALICWSAVVLYEDRVHSPAPYASLFVVLFSGAVLMALRRLTVPERLRPLLGRLAGAAFGAYLVHLLILTTISGDLVSADAGWAEAVGLLVGLTAATVVLSFGCSLLWGRLGLRRWLG